MKIPPPPRVHVCPKALTLIVPSLSGIANLSAVRGATVPYRSRKELAAEERDRSAEKFPPITSRNVPNFNLTETYE